MSENLVTKPSESEADSEGEPTAEGLSGMLYRHVARDDAFDAIERATRKTLTEFIVYPFNGPALMVTVAPARE